MSKSLKDQNNWKIWTILSINCMLFYSIIISNKISLHDVNASIVAAKNLLPACVAGIVATVLNSLPSPNSKAKLVFLRWTNPLPGHRAFSKYGPQDPRVDMKKIKTILKNKIPTDSQEQNIVWYRLYKTLPNDPTVMTAHRDFLLLRDYAALSFILIFVFGFAGFLYIKNVKVSFLYLFMLFLQFFITRHAAANSGIRMVTNVLAIKSAHRPQNSKVRE